MRIPVENYQQQAVYGTEYGPPTSTSSSLAGNILSSTPEPPPADQDSDILLTQPTSSNASRYCSVRGCNKPLSYDSNNKMCDVCRGRHRIYATTKRAKRKMEKAAIVSQNLVHIPPEQRPPIWMPESSLEPQEAAQESPVYHHEPSQPTPPSVDIDTTPQVPIFVSPSSASRGWDYDPALDPRLFMPQSSELAGALTLPNTSNQRTQPSHHSNTSSEPSSVAAGNGSLDDHEAAESLVDPDEPADDPSSSASAQGSSSPRYCSVKGCKAVIPGDYFFKMCEPCRNRYRGYGITKRAKWKQSRSAANAELDALREEEDKRRVDMGLKPLEECIEEFLEWEKTTIERIDGGPPSYAEDDSTDGPILPARMCTVSHCHKILSGHYKYRRCEQHRLQNRYHSRLKRVREKETKSYGPPGDSEDDEEQDEEQNLDGRPRKIKVLEPLFTNAPIDVVRGTRDEDFDGEEGMQFLLQMAGIPPAARGIRRTNHVCSVKSCYNLLAPHVPWKMCDTCRAHDRRVRNSKRMRDMGKLPPLPLREPKEPKKSKAKTPRVPKQKKAKNVSEAPSNAEGTEVPTAEVNEEPSTSAVISASNELPEVEGHVMDSVKDDHLSQGQGSEHDSASAQATIPVQPDEGPSSTTGDGLNHPEQSVANVPPSDSSAAPSNTSSTPAAPPVATVRRRRKRQVVQSVETTAVNPAQEAPSTQTTDAPQPPGPATAVTGASTTSTPHNLPPDAHPYVIPPQYQVPYYMPPPYNMPPYNMPHHQPYPSPSHGPPPAQGYPSHPPQPPPPQPQHGPYPSQPYGSYPPYPYSSPYPQQPYPYLSRSFMPSPYNVPPPPYPPPYGAPLYQGQSAYNAPPQTQHPSTKSRDLQFQTPTTGVGVPQRRKRGKLPIRADTTNTESASASASVISAANDGAVPEGSHSRSRSQGSRTSSEPDDEEGGVSTSLLHQGTNDTPDDENIRSSPLAIRQCTKKSCRRTLSTSSVGSLCERCRARIKKYQVRAKQRFRLEPRKPIVTTV